MDWDRLRLFHTVAESGSFTRAGERLGLTQSSISRQIKALEESLETSLFNRHARGLVLTGEGEQLFATVTEMARAIEATQADLLETRERPRGRLRVTSTVALGTSWLASTMAEFVATYPEIRLEMILDDEDLNLSRREADVAIRVHRPQQQDLIQLKLMTVKLAVYASTAYLDRKGTPTSVADFDDHDLLAYGPRIPQVIDGINWTLTAGGRRRHPFFAVNNVFGLMRAAEAGMGIVVLPDYVAALSDRLTAVPIAESCPTIDVYFVYAQEMRKSKRIGALKDYLQAAVKDRPLPKAPTAPG